jgi:hypothetical protein
VGLGLIPIETSSTITEDAIAFGVCGSSVANTVAAEIVCLRWLAH